ncbi:tetratricopeptide repeat protein [Microbacter margulisiae]|uniref:Tetratricopeptide (TPR) repeat protein n=1 Tax=Microbacter margulisiae TaxID=1350067 RepID=A0A7W5DQC9_9PORP|nr:tetratricopeptide repeat protein [Microbacter margulisiae]MBB3187150.1 tetratricopeptide (TPR) repeat protein [Microbacter margulisiae]
MKRIQFLLIFFLAAMMISAQETSLQKANALYAEGQYTAAAEQYEMIAQIQGESPQLYYNLGNAYYRNGNLGKAILNYNRALLLDPNYGDAEFNLRIAQQKVIDNVDVTSEFFLVQWMADFGDLLSSNQWAIMSIITFVLMLSMGLFYLFSTYRQRKKFSFNIAIFMFFITIVSFGFAEKQSHKVMDSTAGIIMEPAITAKDSPSLNSKDMFVLHEGTKVTIDNQISGWTEIALPDGNEGFIPSTSIEKI